VDSLNEALKQEKENKSTKVNIRPNASQPQTDDNAQQPVMNHRIGVVEYDSNSQNNQSTMMMLQGNG
jgi:hypothetical protein